MTEQHKRTKRASPHNNRIPLPFDQAVEGLLAVKPNKRPARKEKPAKK
jgi:hypothetical protein